MLKIKVEDVDPKYSDVFVYLVQGPTIIYSVVERQDGKLLARCDSLESAELIIDMLKKYTTGMFSMLGQGGCYD